MHSKSPTSSFITFCISRQMGTQVLNQICTTNQVRINTSVSTNNLYCRYNLIVSYLFPNYDNIIFNFILFSVMIVLVQGKGLPSSHSFLSMQVKLFEANLCSNLISHYTQRSQSTSKFYFKSHPFINIHTTYIKLLQNIYRERTTATTTTSNQYYIARYILATVPYFQGFPLSPKLKVGVTPTFEEVFKKLRACKSTKGLVIGVNRVNKPPFRR